MLTQFHVSPNCGPTRGAMMTGVDPHRADMGGNHEVAAGNGVPAFYAIFELAPRRTLQDVSTGLPGNEECLKNDSGGRRNHTRNL